MLLSVWNEQALQLWVIFVAGAIIIWAYYEFWELVLQPWIKKRFPEPRK